MSLVPLTCWKSALITVSPRLTPCADPPFVTRSTSGVSDCQTASDVTSRVEPSVYFAVAVSWAVAPGATCAGPEMTTSLMSPEGPDGPPHAHHARPTERSEKQ